MKIRLDGKDWKVRKESDMTDLPNSKYDERWYSLPKAWFENAKRDQFAKLYFNHQAEVMVVPDSTFEKMINPASSEASKN